MLNILKLKSNYKNPKEVNVYKSNLKAENRYFPPANKEWYDSIYAFNKNTIKALPTANNIVIYYIKSYFNMFNTFLNKKNRIITKRFWLRKLSSKKFWIAKPEVKHTNDKVVVNLYIYNRNKAFYLSKIKKFFAQYKYKALFIFLKKKNKNILSKSINLNPVYLNKLIDFISIDKLSSKSNILVKSYLYNLYKQYYRKHIIRSMLKKELYLMHLIQSSFLNRFKFNSTYISPLGLILNKIYRKKIIFNIIKVKNYFLNSDIFTQIILYKTLNRKNKNILRVLKKSLTKFKPSLIRRRLIKREPLNYIEMQNISLFSINSIHKGDIVENLLEDSNTISKKGYISTVKNKVVSGVRIKASGRLTKRITASRSIVKIRYKGTIKHIDSGFKGTSSVILRGNTKSNMQYTKLNSKLRIGSFGLKGWIGSR